MENVASTGYGADKNGLGQISAFVGVASLILSVIPFGAALSIFLAPVAIVTGLIARRREVKKAATVGLVTGLVSLLIVILMIVIATASLGSSLDQTFAELESTEQPSD